MLWDFNDLQFLAAVVQYCGFSAGARALGLPKSRVSCWVAILEERLGLRLLDRTTRGINLTAVGQQIFEHARTAVIEERTSERCNGGVSVEFPLIGRIITSHPRVRHPKADARDWQQWVVSASSMSMEAVIPRADASSNGKCQQWPRTRQSPHRPARPRGSHRVTMTLYEIDPDAFCSRFYKTPMTSLISQWNG
jgi:Bacterial regulatory helix-turn-helix protein, lysR family